MAFHCFSVDVEGFCESNSESFTVPSGLIANRSELDEIQANIETTLQLLSQFHVKATFFCLGHLASQRPEIIRAIANEKHEIGSHGYWHKRLFNLKSADLAESIIRSKEELEQVSGQKVLGFRAPDFSIQASNIKVLDLIQKAGYLYDSSIYPISMHDVYGIPGARRDLHQLANGMIEFPPSSIRFLGVSFPVLGGGYFRLAPLWVSRLALKHFTRAGMPAMMYLHPYEIGDRFPQVSNLSPYRKFRHYINLSKGKRRLQSIFKEHKFYPAAEFVSSFQTANSTLKGNVDTSN